LEEKYFSGQQAQYGRKSTMKKSRQSNEASQRGSALILTIMMMMTLGLLALNTVNQHLNAALSLTRSEKNHLVAWELAASSLNWGISRRWALQATNQWQCAEQPDDSSANSQLRSCFKPADLADYYVVRGEGKGVAVESVFLYQLATLKIINPGEIRLSAIKDGWLDFCPLKDETKCSEKEPADEPTGRIKFT